MLLSPAITQPPTCTCSTGRAVAPASPTGRQARYFAGAHAARAPLYRSPGTAGRIKPLRYAPGFSAFCLNPGLLQTPTGARTSQRALRGESGRPLRGRDFAGAHAARTPLYRSPGTAGRIKPLRCAPGFSASCLNPGLLQTPTGAPPSQGALRGESGRPLRGRYLFRLPPAPASSRGGNIRSRGASSPPRPTGPKNYLAAASAGAL